MKIFFSTILFGALTLSVAGLFPFSNNASAEESGEFALNVCIAQFPCHLKTGKLLRGFQAGTVCGWEKICQKYRVSSEFKKLQKKLQRQKRKQLKKSSAKFQRVK